MDRLSTGNDRLDEVLGGGLILNSITLLVGAPGSGKTLLAEQCLFHNSSEEKPGLYLSTVSEPLDKLLRFGQQLSFFNPRKVGRSVLYDELGSVLAYDGLEAALERTDDLLKEHQPGLVVIDSFKALKAFASTQSEFRHFLHELAGRVTALAVTSLWVGEYDATESMSSPEFAVADAVIDLSVKRTGERASRYLTVHKLRGSGFAAGDHAYRLSPDGLVVYPRLAGDGPEPPERAGALGTERLSSGIPALDQSLADGYWPGSTTLVVGPSGAGKTVMGLHFLYAGAATERGILLSLQESPDQLSRIIEGFGWSITHPSITVLDCQPVDLIIDEVVYSLLDTVRESGATRVVVDSLNDLAVASPDTMRFREFIHTMSQRLRRAGVSIMYTLESPQLYRISELGDLGISHTCDNAILLQHVRDGTQMKRTLTVLKTRGASHATTIREFHIGANGITLGEPLDPRVGAS